jgi:UDP-2,3-diacylglucosamine pyrophosphatase LpxH
VAGWNNKDSEEGITRLSQFLLTSQVSDERILIMHWDEFCQLLNNADSKFSTIKEDLLQYKAFLNRSSLFIFCGTVQIPFKRDFTAGDLKSISEILMPSEFRDNLFCLTDCIDRLEDEQKAMSRQKRSDPLKKVTEELVRAKDELNTFPLKELEVEDGITIQIIYPSIDIEAIQVVKLHKLVNQEKTCKCRACVRTILQ